MTGFSRHPSTLPPAAYETIGNATLIVENDEGPVLATDVWYEEDPAYFGSWVLSHHVPQAQRQKIGRAPYLYISHFHPDHLNLASLRHHRGQKIILAQHYGSRVATDLRKAGFTVLCLPSRRWIELAAGVRIMLFHNELQDSALLVELSHGDQKTLLVNLNDSGGYGFGYEVKAIARRYSNSVLLALHGYGDADMINFWDEQGQFIEPFAARKLPVGPQMRQSMDIFGCTLAIPFSSFHQYQRRDSWWANRYTTPEADYSLGFEADASHQLLPPFQRVELLADDPGGPGWRAHSLQPPPLQVAEPIPEQRFGDDWTTPLQPGDLEACQDYFAAVPQLAANYGRIQLQVAGSTHTVTLSDAAPAISFALPRRSLMRSVRHCVFDDLLIGNFMRTTLHGSSSLYQPDFNLLVAKYSDNALVRDSAQLKDMFGYYKRNRSWSDRLSLALRRPKAALFDAIPSGLVQAARSLYHRL
ncbi:MAG: hypothetical protein ACK52U_13590 [Synechococcaceae cyanobacterium]